ncbi:hypothetical protein F2Q70_00035745 [Brassica cretica]|uniref:DUF223 domain-containing protein n=1 Tax=Brassica cretica TaxID=69181 RepID=A0A8S9JY54_BRACR|nr:hypothetical protein F2Q70_00035745 [Brassica cretica]
MANARVFLSDLKSGRCSEVRLLRFWEARNIKRGDELMSVEMLLLDSNVTSSQQTLTFSRKIFLNATSGTRYDKETDAGESYFYNSFFVEGFAKVEPMKIAELNQFIITPQPQSIKFICTGKVRMVLHLGPWRSHAWDQFLSQRRCLEVGMRRRTTLAAELQLVSY